MTDTPQPADLRSLAYDAMRARTVLFREGVTWTWDGAAWERETPATSPSKRGYAAMTYDAARGRVVLFGGIDATPLGDTWEWDGVTWEQKMPATKPPARSSHMLAYDSDRKRVVLFGGDDPGGPLRDTWEYDGTTWTRVVAESLPPSRGSMTYDSVRKRIVLVAGTIEAPITGIKAVTYEWDGATWTAKGNSPTALITGITFDTQLGKTILFGGGLSDSLPSNETWSWDGTAWTKLTSAGAPSVRRSIALTYDTTRKRAVLFGGRTIGTTFGDTWEWDGATWSDRTPVLPPPRVRPALAYDGSAVLMYGGDPAKDGWRWNGTSWSPATSTSAPSNGFGAMTYDPIRKRVVRFDESNETWEWNGAWTRQTPATRTPTGTESNGMTFDPTSSTSILVRASATVWSWEGTDWTYTGKPTDAEPLSYPAAAYDVARKRLVLVSRPKATSATTLTWEFDGATWSTKSTTPIGAGPVAWVPSLNKVLMVEQKGASWVWDGTTWSKLEVANEPPLRNQPAVAFDPTRKRLVMFGGESASVLNETWELDLDLTPPAPDAGLPDVTDAISVGADTAVEDADASSADTFVSDTPSDAAPPGTPPDSGGGACVVGRSASPLSVPTIAALLLFVGRRRSAGATRRGT